MWLIVGGLGWIAVVATVVFSLLTAYFVYSAWKIGKRQGYTSLEDQVEKEGGFLCGVIALFSLNISLLGFIIPNLLGWGEDPIRRLVAICPILLLFYGWNSVREAQSTLEVQGAYPDHTVINQKVRGEISFIVGIFFSLFTVWSFLGQPSLLIFG